MPLKKYFGGHGEKVMASMKKEYGEKKGEEVFYATANKQKGKVKGRGKNPFFGNALPFQLGSGKRWFDDSRKKGKGFSG